MPKSNDSSLTLFPLYEYNVSIAGHNGFISDELTYFLESLNYFFLSGVLGVFGCVANVINIVIFYHLGFSDPVNVTLAGLAFSDFCALLSLVWMSICFSPPLRDGKDFPLDFVKVQYLTAGWPLICFGRITSWITAFVTFERCMCIARPHSFRQGSTRGRAVCVLVLIYSVMILSVSPAFFAMNLDYDYDEYLNRTLITLVYRDGGAVLENISFSINVASQLITLLIVIVCTCQLVRGLRNQTKWRDASSQNSSTTSLGQRDKRLVKLVTGVSVIFICCFVPTSINLIAMLALPSYSIVGRFKNLFQVSWSFINTIEAVNASVNIFVYFRLSSKYKQEFLRLFPRCFPSNDSALSKRNELDNDSHSV